jgi:type I restriction enzyme S subunit
MQNRHDKDTIKRIEKAKFHLTNIEEQTAIAQLLYAANKEIALFKATAEKLREQKKGLMQVLLTGKIRLKINTSEI